LETVGSSTLWIVFVVGVLVMLAIDLAVHRSEKPVPLRSAVLWTLIWTGVAAGFGAYVHVQFGHERGLEWGTAWVLEYALSVDNLFIFIVVFSTFAVPEAVQHRVLFWGVLGALVLRAGFIIAGAALVQAFAWILYFLGAVLIFTAGKLLFGGGDDEVELEKNWVLRWFKKVVPTTSVYDGRNFWTRVDGKLHATPLFLVLIVVETTDLVFAIDSVPAALAVSQDPFIVFTSNVLAILGLRTLFFLLHALMSKLRFLKYGLGLVLAFVGFKLVGKDFVHVPVAISLSIVGILLGGAVIVSWLVPPPKEPMPATGPEPEAKRLGGDGASEAPSDPAPAASDTPSDPAPAPVASAKVDGATDADA
jgi:tellurite resistance protein TerC